MSISRVVTLEDVPPFSEDEDDRAVIIPAVRVDDGRSWRRKPASKADNHGLNLHGFWRWMMSCSIRPSEREDDFGLEVCAAMARRVPARSGLARGATGDIQPVEVAEDSRMNACA